MCIDSNYRINIECIEEVHSKFLCMYAFQLNINSEDTHYAQLRIIARLPSLNELRIAEGNRPLICLCSLLNNVVNCPEVRSDLI